MNASQVGISPLDGFKQFLGNSSSSTKINFAQGCELWSNDESGFPAAVQAAQNSDVAVVMVSDALLCTTLCSECPWIIPGRYLESGSDQSLDAWDKCYNGRARRSLRSWTGRCPAEACPSRQGSRQANRGRIHQRETYSRAVDPSKFVHTIDLVYTYACSLGSVDADAVIQQFYPGESGGERPLIRGRTYPAYLTAPPT